MRKTETSQETRTVTRTVLVACDLCGRKINPPMDSAEEVVIKHRTGVYHRDGSSHGEERIVDMCGTCFEEKLVPWLREQGVDATPTAWDS